MKKHKLKPSLSPGFRHLSGDFLATKNKHYSFERYFHFDNDYWTQTVSVLKAFYEKEIPIDYLLSKIQNWKATSQAISRKYKSLNTFYHAPSGAIEQSIQKKENPPIKMQENVKYEHVNRWVWNTAKDEEILKKLFE